MITEIVVNGRVQRDPLGTWLLDLDRLSSPGTPVLSRYEGGGGSRSDIGVQPFDGDTNDGSIVVSVNVQVSNPANLPAAQKAAENVVAALALLESVLNDIPPSTAINWAGTTYTATQVLSIIHNTQFVITDSAYTNGGVGQATAGSNGAAHSVALDVRFFDGDLANSSGRDYAAPTYTNLQGMVGILLHEVGHLTPEGANFHLQSHRYYRLENNGSDAGFNSSNYFENREAFSNDFAVSVATTIGFDISQLSNNWATAWERPVDLNNLNMGF